MIVQIRIRAIVILFSLFIAVGIGFGAAPSNRSVPLTKLRVTVTGGSILNAQFRVKALQFKTSIGVMAIKVADIDSFRDGDLTLTDGTSLKGKFTDSKFSVELPMGPMEIPVDKIVAMDRLPPPTVPNPAATVHMGGPQLVGRVLDNFGRPLSDVAVAISNTQFATKTNVAGAYAIGYAPGQITVTYEKAGYHGDALKFDLSQPSRVPVRDINLVKNPPGALCFLGKNDYLAAKPAKVLAKTSGNILAGEAVYFMTGRPVPIFGRTARFMANTRTLGGSSLPELYRVGAGGVFMREIGQGLVTRYTYTAQNVRAKAQQSYGDFRIYSAKLTPGLYALVTRTSQMPWSARYVFGDPAYMLRVQPVATAGGKMVAGSNAGRGGSMPNLTKSLVKWLARTPRTPSRPDLKYSYTFKFWFYSAVLTMHYPANFQIKKRTLGRWFIAPHKAPDANLAPNIMIGYGNAPWGTNHLWNLANSIFKADQRKMPDATFSRLVLTKIAGHQAYSFESVNGAVVQVRVLALFNGHELFLNFNSTRKTFSHYWDDFSRLWNSLSIH